VSPSWEIRREGDGALDEIVASNATVQLECMDARDGETQWFLGITVGKVVLRLGFTALHVPGSDRGIHVDVDG